MASHSCPAVTRMSQVFSPAPPEPRIRERASSAQSQVLWSCTIAFVSSLHCSHFLPPQKQVKESTFFLKKKSSVCYSWFYFCSLVSIWVSKNKCNFFYDECAYFKLYIQTNINVCIDKCTREPVFQSWYWTYSIQQTSLVATIIV